MWDGEPFDAEGFKVHLAACDATTELFAAFALNTMHCEGGGGDDYDEDTKDDEEEDPEAG